METDAELQRIKDAVAGEGSDRSFSRKIVVVVAGGLAATLSVAFLGFLAIKIGAPPLIVIIFGVLAMMGYDFFDTMRGMMNPASGPNHDNNND